MLCAQRLYYGNDQFYCPLPNGLNHCLPLNKTGAHSTGERFRATMALLFFLVINVFTEGHTDLPHKTNWNQWGPIGSEVGSLPEF